MYDEADEELRQSKYRYKDCVHLSGRVLPEFYGYQGQGDCRLVIECAKNALKYLNVYNPQYASFACPRYCQHYVGLGRVE